MEACIFCSIAQGDIPSARIYEDDEVLVFMDLNPIIKGHALVVPKAHYADILETPDDILASLHTVAKRIGEAQMNGLGADGVNIVQNNGAAAGQEIGHIHVHVIPRFDDDGHHWNWNTKTYKDNDEMAELAEKMRIELQGL